MSYIPRTTQPSNDDLRYRSNDNHEGSNGYNNFPNVGATWGGLTPYLGSVLANCTGYCQGRWMELGNTNTPYAFHGNAEDWINEAKAAGYKTGSEPQLGAIVVFAGWPKNIYGHVGIVEDIGEDGSFIICSESNYGVNVFEYPVIRYRETGWKRKGSSSGASIGFIYHPDIDVPVPVHKLEVTGGIPSEKYGTEGETIEITVDKTKIPKEYSFMRWELVSGGGELVGDVSRETITYKFGDKDGSVKALYKYTPPSMNISLYISPPVYRKY